MDSIIETIHLSKYFGDFAANDQISIQVAPGEIKCIVGENGAGKSTLMNMLYGLLTPSSGEIRIRGKLQSFRNPQDAMAAGIGMVHQHFKLVPSLSVYENILLGSEILLKKGKLHLPFVDRTAEIRQVQKLIETHAFDLNPMDKIEDLSVGARQRVEILKMLYRNVDILILDEPTAVLSPQEADRLIETLKQLKKSGKTIIIITHKLREVMTLADSITVIKQGRVIGHVDRNKTDEKQLAQMMVGRTVLLRVQNEGNVPSGTDIIYEVKDLSTISDAGKEIVSNVSFTAARREILGIAGVEGNGQSELVKLLTGLMTSTKGSIRMEGKDITNFWPKQLRAIGIGIIPEDRYAQGLCKTMSISENSIAGYHGDHDICRYGFYRKQFIRHKRDAFIRNFDIRLSDPESLAESLSGGNAQKLIIARELSASPKILIACQPTRGVDIGSIEFIHSALLEYRNAGNTVILISSELSEIMNLADRILVMYKGRLLGRGIKKKLSIEEIGLLMGGILQEGEEYENL